MDYSDPACKTRRMKLPLWLGLGQAGIGVSVVGVGLLLTVTSVSAWWFGSDFWSSHQAPAGLVLTPLRQTTAFSLEPIVSNSGQIEPTAVPTMAPQPTIAPRPHPTAVPSPASHPAATAQATTQPIGTVADQILQLVNQERTSRGLTPLQLNNQLTAAAQAYAELMQRQGFFSHTAPDGMTFSQRDEAAGYTGWTWLGENIAYGQTSASQVMTEWMNSPEHKANILEPRARDLGVGYAPGSTPYWVQDFGAK